MLPVVAVGCGVVLGLAGAELAGPLYWRLLARCPLPRGRLARLVWRVHRTLLAQAGHHPYVVGCVDALAQATDAAAVAAVRGRLRWWAAVRRSR